MGLHSDPTDDDWDAFDYVVPYFTQVVEPLVGVSSDVEPEPLLATDWTAIDDTTWEFDLREGVTFHDGTDLTAADVVASFEATFDHWPWVDGWTGLDPGSTTAVDETTVRFETTDPFPAFPGAISHHYFAIQNHDAADAPVGTGPFEVDTTEDGEVRLVAFEQYRNETPEPSALTFRHLEDDTTRVLSLENGDIDIAHDVPKDQAAAVDEHPETTIQTQVGNHAGLVAVNLYKSPTDDEGLRRALNWAVDQAELVETVLDGIGMPARGPFSSSIPWSIHEELPAYGPDRDRARELVDDSSYDGEELSMLVDSEDGDDSRIAEVLQNWFDEIGVATEIVQVDPASFYDTFVAGEANLTIVGFGSNSAASDYLVRAMFHSRGSDNYQRYEADGTGVYNPGDEVDRLIEDGYRAETGAEKREYYGEVQRRVLETGAIVPLYYDEYVLGTRASVSGIETHPIDKMLEWTELSRTARGDDGA
ncbi:peptide ABC transporter substrate-binding protein [Salinadaptatus halalkaliphilus]|uniref:Peptide ABC transporter substrate-binding protein n=1 Tax=Salinadaptatus halalkaliphilus TaxID=2419781 RepID=A0A4S3TN06_9EURY|nr:peptide ABC transporter substrate-binding protein [Salinadaptatus halalkaliphilus]